MNKSERLNQELIFLSHKKQFNLNELINEFSISKRTALRDVAALSEMGLPFYVENGRHGGYRIISQKLQIPVYFSPRETEAIFFALKALDLLSSSPFDNSYPSIRKKLLATMPIKEQEKIEQILSFVGYVAAEPVSQSDNLALILQVILEEQVLHVTDSQRAQEADLQVLDLFYRSGVWFCSAYDLLRKKWGIYRADKLLDCSIITVPSSETYSRFELENFQKEYEKNYRNIPYSCKLTDFGQELVRKNHYETMEVVGGRLTGRYNLEELDYLLHYLVSLGSEVEIEFPDSLKSAYINKLEQILKKY